MADGYLACQIYVAEVVRGLPIRATVTERTTWREFMVRKLNPKENPDSRGRRREHSTRHNAPSGAGRYLFITHFFYLFILSSCFPSVLLLRRQLGYFCVAVPDIPACVLLTEMCCEVQLGDPFAVGSCVTHVPRRSDVVTTTVTPS